jgi:hypothetical protein
LKRVYLSYQFVLLISYHCINFYQFILLV